MAQVDVTDLRLGLPGGDDVQKKEEKRDEIGTTEYDATATTKKPVAAVGWPPVCSYQRKGIDEASHNNSKRMVKISMDGVPFLRKINLNDFIDYYHLLSAVAHLFTTFPIGEAFKEGENSNYIPIYEDNEGDWLLVGDVPWKMFVESCKRLRIMKRSDGKGFGKHAFKK